MIKTVAILNHQGSSWLILQMGCWWG